MPPSPGVCRCCTSALPKPTARCVSVVLFAIDLVASTPGGAAALWRAAQASLPCQRAAATAPHHLTVHSHPSSHSQVLSLVPTAGSRLLPLVVGNFPHKLRDRNTQCLYLVSLSQGREGMQLVARPCFWHAARRVSWRVSALLRCCAA